MKFRYKVKKGYECMFHDIVTHYYVHVQKLNSKGTRWKKFAKTDLKDIVERVTGKSFGTSNNSCYEATDEYLETCLFKIKEYGGIDEVMSIWIKSAFKEMSDNELEIQRQQNNITELDKMLLCNGWKTIDIEVDGNE